MIRGAPWAELVLRKRPQLHPLIGQARRFLIVGLVGFATDASVLHALLSLELIGPLWARAPSFLLAVTVTFALNRIWTFADRGPKVGTRGYLAYIAVQLGGLATNFGVYAILVTSAAGPLALPLVALAIGAACSLVVNFFGARWLAFPVSASRAHPT